MVHVVGSFLSLSMPLTLKYISLEDREQVFCAQGVLSRGGIMFAHIFRLSTSVLGAAFRWRWKTSVPRFAAYLSYHLLPKRNAACLARLPLKSPFLTESIFWELAPGKVLPVQDRSLFLVIFIETPISQQGVTSLARVLIGILSWKVSCVLWIDGVFGKNTIINRWDWGFSYNCFGRQLLSNSKFWWVRKEIVMKFSLIISKKLRSSSLCLEILRINFVSHWILTGSADILPSRGLLSCTTDIAYIDWRYYMHFIWK